MQPPGRCQSIRTLQRGYAQHECNLSEQAYWSSTSAANLHGEGMAQSVMQSLLQLLHATAPC